uniref:Protein-glutamine gamma-glutamyltransferase-like C-terminal domain-containing protein n=1 Tax=uncultured bacterium Csd4 TaxID=1637487 RepID=A0A0F6SKK5_9BACT|nr:hypothetical protein [uncultured bacterium Csd4]
MTDNSNVMLDESLARSLASGHDYDSSLGVESQLEQLDYNGKGLEPPSIDTSFVDGIVNFLSSLPTLVWVILGIVVVALLLYWMSRAGLLNISKKKDDDDAFDEEDDVYKIDFDEEMEQALRNQDHAAIVRLVYLRTLRTLDERKLIHWHLSKTPTQFARELNVEAFSTMTRHFLRVRYGKFAASKKMSDEMQTLSEEVLKEKGGEE